MAVMLGPRTARDLDPEEPSFRTVSVLRDSDQTQHRSRRHLVVFVPRSPPVVQPSAGTSNVAGPTSTSTSRSPSQIESPRKLNGLRRSVDLDWSPGWAE